MDDKKKERLEKLENAAMDLTAILPTDAWLKGDGSIWICTPNHPAGRKVKQQEVLEIIFKAAQAAGRMISI